MKSLVHTILLMCVATSIHAMDSQQTIDVPEQLSLEQSLVLAVEWNPNLHEVRERLAEQHGIFLEVRGQILPQLGVGAGYDWFQSSLGDRGPGIPLADRDWRLRVGVRQIIFAGGSVLANIRAQSFNEEALLSEIRSATEDVLFEVRRLYYTALLSDEEIEVQEENVRLLEEELENARRRQALGDSSEFDVLRAEVELANAQPALIRARNRSRISRDALFRVMGLDQNYRPENVYLDSDFQEAPIEMELPEALHLANIHRSEIRAARSQVRAREELVTASKGRRVPVLSLTGGYEWRKPFISNSFSDADEGWGIGLEATWDIFEGGSRSGRILQARSRLRQSEQQSRETRLQIDFEVREAYAILQEARELTAAANQVITQAEESLRLANERLNAGAATQLDVLSARVGLTSARVNKVRSEFELAVGRAGLRRAMGYSSEYVWEQ